VIAEAVARLKTFRAALKGVDRNELQELRHSGHRF